MRTIAGRQVLVTGGAAGIGRAIAARFAAEGAALLLTDIDEAALAATVGGFVAQGARAKGYRLDVTDAAAILDVRSRIEAGGEPVDILVNNAGVVFGGPFLEVSLERHFATYRVNTLGMVAMTHAFLPHLVSRPEAHLVNIASASGFLGLPFGSTYASSKWAAIGFSESIRLELRGLGHGHVGVTTICPSYVATGLFAGVKTPRTTSMLTPDGLAARVVRAVRRQQVFVLTPWLVRITPFMRGVLPVRAFDALSSVFGATKGMTSWKGHGR